MAQQRSSNLNDYNDQPPEGDKAGAGASAGAQELAGNIAEQAREYGEKVQDAVREFKPFVEKSMKEQPMQTLAGAAAIGFLLGAIWKK